MALPRILILTSYFLPGFRAGGPIRSVANMVSSLSSEFEFFVMTRDRDLGSREPYSDIARDTWVVHEGVKVMYVSNGRLSLDLLRLVLSELRPDLIYMNSLFDLFFSLRPQLWMASGLLARSPRAILAPRGELLDGALAIKPRRKKIFLGVARLFGFYRHTHWQASTLEEADAIRAHFGHDLQVSIAPNLPSGMRLDVGTRPAKAKGRARFVFVGRIARNKNVLGMLEVFRDVRAEVQLTLVGPREDSTYWEACERAIAELPPNVTVHSQGAVEPAALGAELGKHEFFMSLSHGENFGHAIVEGFMMGLPALISDRTPWRNLRDRNAGWDC